MKKTIPFAPNYEMTSAGVITNVKTGSTMTVKNGLVRLNLNGKQVPYKIEDQRFDLCTGGGNFYV